MAIFFLGTPDSDSYGDPNLLVEYPSAAAADAAEPEDWCAVEAPTLGEARLAYEEQFEAWQNRENALYLETNGVTPN